SERRIRFGRKLRFLVPGQDAQRERRLSRRRAGERRDQRVDGRFLERLRSGEGARGERRGRAPCIEAVDEGLAPALDPPQGPGGGLRRLRLGEQGGQVGNGVRIADAP